jgi:hypothetical protein
MIDFPSRVTSLIQRLEAGETPTQEELRRTVLLQALDTAKLGEDYVRELCQENSKQTEEFRAYLEQ